MAKKYPISTHLPPFDPVTLGIQWAVFNAYARSLPRHTPRYRQARTVALSAYGKFPSMGEALLHATELGFLLRARITPLGLEFVREFEQRQSVPAQSLPASNVVTV